MGHSRAEKADNHDRVLGLAAAQIRKNGLGAVNVAEIMQAAGLTHGGFYRHFASRDALIAEALVRAFDDGEALASAASAGAPRSLPAFVRGYLSKAHRDAPERGCAIAALSGEIAHADDAAKAVLTERLSASVAAVAEILRLENPDAGEAQGLAIMSTLVGALVLSRAVDDQRLSDALLLSARELVLGRNS